MTRPYSASRARHASSNDLAGSASRQVRACEQLARADGSIALGGSCKLAAPVAQLRRQLFDSHGHIQADPEHRPALLRASLDEDAGELGEGGERLLVDPPSRGCQLLSESRPIGRSITTSFGHFTRASSPMTSHTATPAIKRQQRRWISQDERAQQRAASAVPSKSALPPSPGALLFGGDGRAVRCSGDRQPPRPLVGGVGATQVYARMAELAGGASGWSRSLLGLIVESETSLEGAGAPRASASSASTSPSTSWRSAST